MHPALGAGYAAAGALARMAAALAPSGEGKLVRTLRARRGLLDRWRAWAGTHRDPARSLLWMHAPSVGEGLQARPVLELARARRPDLQLAYTHFSPSAERFASSLAVDFAEYLPFDSRGDVDAALALLAPQALVFAKLDVWPVLVERARARGTRVGMISATLAEGSSRARGLARALLADAYAALDAVGAIDDRDAERLLALGVRADVISVTGDTRYDQVWARARAANRDGSLLAPLASARPTLVAGSTWPADELPLLQAWRTLRARVPDARLIIAPHEPTRDHLEPVDRALREAGQRVALLGADDVGEADTVLVDRVGVLGDLYALADAAYVGGGFHAAGLHSVLEPAAFGAPVAFGPSHDASRDAALLLDAGGGASSATAGALAEVLVAWLGDATTRERAGAAARRVVENGLGAAERSWALVERLLDR